MGVANNKFVENVNVYLSQCEVSLNISDIQNRNQKDRGQDLEQGPSQPQTETTRGQEEVVMPAAQQSQDQISPAQVFHFRPDLASNFVKMVRRCLQVTGDNQNLLKLLKQYKVSSKNKKVNIYKQAHEYLQELNINNATDFTVIIPVAVRDSDIFLKSGIDEIKICLREALTLERGVLTVIKINTLIFIDHRNLYVEPTNTVASKFIYYNPEFYYTPHNYIFGSYLIAHHKITLPAETVLFRIRGFNERLNQLNLEQPQVYEIRDGKVTDIEVECGHTVIPTQETAHFTLIPHLIENRLTNMTYEALSQGNHLNEENLTPALAHMALVLNTMTVKDEFHEEPSQETQESSGKEEKSLNNNISRTPVITTESVKDLKFPDNITPEGTRRYNNILFATSILHMNSVSAKNILKYFLTFKEYFTLYQDVTNAKKKDIYIKNSLLFKQKSMGLDSFWTLTVPERVGKMILDYFHNNGGLHLTSRQLKETFDRQFNFVNPKSNKTAFSQTVNKCVYCSLSKPPKNTNETGGKRTFDPKMCFEHLVVDASHNYPLSEWGNRHGIHIICALSGFQFFLPCKTLTAAEMVEKISEIFKIFGSPASISTDSANSWDGEFSLYLKSLGIIHHKRTSRVSKAQGSAEISLKLLRDALSRFISAAHPSLKSKWDLFSAQIVRAFNLTNILNSKIPRSNLFLSSQHLFSTPANFYLFSNENITNQLKLLRDHRSALRQKAEKGYKSRIETGALATKPISKDLRPQISNSKHLQSTSQNIYKVLDSCQFSALIKDVLHGGLSTAKPSELEPIDFKNMNMIWPPNATEHMIESAFEQSKARKSGGGQSSFIMPPELLNSLPLVTPQDQAGTLAVTPGPTAAASSSSSPASSAHKAKEKKVRLKIKPYIKNI